MTVDDEAASNASVPAKLDSRDRALLALLSQDATLSYVELGKAINLSAPAVHDRVKRLRAEGVIKATVASLDGIKLGRPFLAFVHVDTTSYSVAQQYLELQEFDEIEEIHTTTGDSAVLLKVRTQDTRSFERLLARLHAIDQISGTRSYIALTTYLERGPSPLAD
jgi:Lrp/AsnC family leucine-responsive transcriptional regulator